MKDREIRSAANDGEGVTLVGLGEADLTEEGVLVAGVITLYDGDGFRGCIWQYLAQGIVGGHQVLVHVDVRDVQGFAAFVEFPGEAIFWQHVLNLEPGGTEEVAEGVLVLLAVHATDQRPTGGRVAGAVGGDEGCG